MARPAREPVQRVPLSRQVIFWLAALVLFLAALFIFSPILLPFVLGMAIAYLLDPIADWFESRGLSRLAATIVILMIFLVILLVVLITLVPVLVNQTVGLVARLPVLVDELQEFLQPVLDTSFFQFFGVDSDTLRTSLAGWTSQGSSWLTAVLASLWSGGRALVGFVTIFVVTPVVAFYLIYDWPRMLQAIDRWLPREHAPTIRALARDINRAIAGFLRGQLLLCLILGVFYAIALGIIQLNFGLLIGFGAGLLSFIPFAGSIIGFVVAVSVALVQFLPEWGWVLATAGIFLVGQFVEGNVLQPKLVGNSVGLHPVWLMFALFAFGLLFGAVGAILAVPAAAAVGVLVRYGLHRYLLWSFYRGSGDLTLNLPPVPDAPRLTAETRQPGE